MSDPIAAARELAPSGTLRAAINYGNPVLARRGPDGAPGGISADLARELARRLAVPLAFVPYEQAGQVFAGFEDDAWDVCFMAIEPVRAAKLAFTAPYVLIEGVYAVAQDSAIHDIGGVDAVGVRIGVVQGSAYDLYLTRELAHATLVRVPAIADVPGLLRDQRVDVVAGVRPQVEGIARALAGTRVLPGAFMTIRQAMATARAKEVGAAYLSAFIDDAKSSGLVRELFARNAVQGGTLAE